MENLTKNLKIDALSRYLNIKSIKKYFIKNLIKNLKKAPYQKKNLIKNLKKSIIMSKKYTLSKKPHHKSKKVPYQGNLKQM